MLVFSLFQGTIEIDMDKKKLDLVVMPQQGSQGQTTTSNLSGGRDLSPLLLSSTLCGNVWNFLSTFLMNLMFIWYV